MIKAGIAGAGFAASFHYESIQQASVPGIQPWGVYSKTKEHREAFAHERGLKAYDSMESMLDEVDVVHLCIPAAMHEYVAVEALKRNVHVIHEKPFTGYFGPSGNEAFAGNEFPKAKMKAAALASAKRIIDAENTSCANIYYAENWMFAPVIQKEAEIIKKTKAQILWMVAEEAHSGSHSQAYGVWRLAGGGSLMGKGCHPLTASKHSLIPLWTARFIWNGGENKQE